MKQTLTTRHTYTTASVTEAASNSTPAEVAMPLLRAPPGEPRNCCCLTHCTVKRAKHISSFYTTQPSTQQEAQYTTAACQLLPLHARHCRCRCTDTVCHTQVPLLLLSLGHPSSYTHTTTQAVHHASEPPRTRHASAASTLGVLPRHLCYTHPYSSAASAAATISCPLLCSSSGHDLQPPLPQKPFTHNHTALQLQRQ